MIRRVFAIIAVLFALAAPAAAQDAEPQYIAYYSARQLASDDPAQVEAAFIVTNQGAAAASPATVELRRLGETNVLASAQVPPLASGQTYDLRLRFPLAALPDVQPRTQIVNFELTMRSPEFNAARLLAEFDLPAPPSAPAVPPAAATPAPSSPSVSIGLLERAEAEINAAIAATGLNVTLDLNDRWQLAGLVGVVLVLAIMLWLAGLVLRLIFVPKPTYPTPPPPYAGMLPYDPNTYQGRRQMWQNATLHGSMLAESTEGNLHARKLLTDTAGVRYSGWRVVGVRASQYDTYGRVSRTQVIAPRRAFRSLNGALERAESITYKGAQRRVRPVVKYVVGKLRGKIKRRGAALPIALDVKFKGEHGEVNIVFELYQFQVGAWRQLDRWQPEMTVPGKSIYEAYTYTLHGLQPDETMRQFRKRLLNDMTFLLTEMVMCTPPPPVTPHPTTYEATRPGVLPDHQPSPPTTPNIRPVPPPSDDQIPAVNLSDTAEHRAIETQENPPPS